MSVFCKHKHHQSLDSDAIPAHLPRYKFQNGAAGLLPALRATHSSFLLWSVRWGLSLFAVQEVLGTEHSGEVLE